MTAQSVVEVTISERCPHDCYTVQHGSRTVWRIAGARPFTLVPEERVVIHAEECMGEACEEEVCWA